MGMGIGHTYWVQVIRMTWGTLDECIKFMKENPPRYKTEFYELRPEPNLRTRTCEKYSCQLIKIDKTSIKSKEKKQ